MSDKEKVNGSRVQKQSNEKNKESNEQKEKEKNIHNRLEELRRWFETQGGCE